MSWFRLDVILFMAGYAIIVLLIIIGKKLAHRKSKIVNEKVTENRLDEVSVVIPFRNEIENLPTLIDNLRKSKKWPLEFIFINDHSDDGSTELLQNLNLQSDVRLINLEIGEEGKKMAIQKGVNEAKGKYILTWDADITFSSTYFESLLSLDWTDLIILPVEMQGSAIIGGFFAWDYQLQTKTSFSLSGWFRPIVASGANLFFKKRAFLEVENTRNDGKYLSGDDQFLLSAFRKTNKCISYSDSKDLVAITKPPDTISQGLAQRSRWLGKTKAVKDSLASVFGLTVLLLQLSYYSFSLYQLTIGNYGAAIILVLIKGELDAFICTYKFQEQFNTFQVFLYELVFPIYIITLGIYTLFRTPYWKKRKTK